ncbi:MAG TPA: sigma-70 family RNA polymerase sigma factor [Acidobacteria bacterium]|nr:sigma-70 family RNA polymerase sigma factor [Acidobacteriota bacterium]
MSEQRQVPADEDLAAWAAGGDGEAFGLLVHRYQRRITGFLAQIVGDLEVARELTQETFLRVWNALDRFDDTYRFSTWIFRIAHNLGVDHLRRRRVPTSSLQVEDRDGRESQWELADSGRDPLGHLENRELAGQLRRTILALRPEYRELVLLRHFAGLSYREIADMKGMPLGTVKNKLFRAHTVLRDTLSEYLRPSGGEEGS